MIQLLCVMAVVDYYGTSSSTHGDSLLMAEWREYTLHMRSHSLHMNSRAPWFHESYAMILAEQREQTLHMRPEILHMKSMC